VGGHGTAQPWARPQPRPGAAGRLGVRRGPGLRAVKLSAAGLGLTAAVQFVIVAASGSVALLADGLHNLGDVFTTVTLWVAFVVGRRQPDRRYTFGYARAEDVAGVLVVLAIAASAVVAAAESLARLPAGCRRCATPAGPWPRPCRGGRQRGRGPVQAGVGRRINSVPLEADGGTPGRRAGQPGRGGRDRRGLGRLAGRRPPGRAAAGRRDRLGAGRTTRDVLARLLDRVDPEVIDEVERAAASVEGVEAVHAARARWVGRSLHVLVHAEVDPDLPLRVAHDLGEQVRHAVFHAVAGVAAVDLHLDPAGVDEHDSHGRTLHHRDQGSR
jgi:divalent metal cation (Fe/Co/Zn/Cd) transporter